MEETWIGGSHDDATKGGRSAVNGTAAQCPIEAGSGGKGGTLVMASKGDQVPKGRGMSWSAVNDLDARSGRMLSRPDK